MLVSTNSFLLNSDNNVYTTYDLDIEKKSWSKTYETDSFGCIRNFGYDQSKLMVLLNLTSENNYTYKLGKIEENGVAIGELRFRRAFNNDFRLVVFLNKSYFGVQVMDTKAYLCGNTSFISIQDESGISFELKLGIVMANFLISDNDLLMDILKETCVYFEFNDREFCLESLDRITNLG